MADQDDLAQRYFCQPCAINLGVAFSQKMTDIESARCSGCHCGRLCNRYYIAQVKST